MYDDPSSIEISRCSLLEKMLEEALVSNEDNLYILRDVFNSNFHPSPNMIMVTYAIFTAQERSTWQLVYNVTIPWTNSRIFTVINPTILFMFQSGILTVTYSNLNRRVINTPQITLNIALSLPVEGNIVFNATEVDYILSTLTKQVNILSLHCV